MGWREWLALHPDSAALWSALCATTLTVFAAAARGNLRITIVLSRRAPSGERQGVVRVQVGPDSSDQIPISGEQRAIIEEDLRTPTKRERP